MYTYRSTTETFKWVQYVYNTVARTNTVRVSDSELQTLKDYRDENYDGYIPLGFVIGELAENESR